MPMIGEPKMQMLQAISTWQTEKEDWPGSDDVKHEIAGFGKPPVLGGKPGDFRYAQRARRSPFGLDLVAVRLVLGLELEVLVRRTQEHFAAESC